MFLKEKANIYPWTHLWKKALDMWSHTDTQTVKPGIVGKGESQNQSHLKYGLVFECPLPKQLTGPLTSSYHLARGRHWFLSSVLVLSSLVMQESILFHPCPQFYDKGNLVTGGTEAGSSWVTQRWLSTFSRTPKETCEAGSTYVTDVDAVPNRDQPWATQTHPHPSTPPSIHDTCYTQAVPLTGTETQWLNVQICWTVFVAGLGHTWPQVGCTCYSLWDPSGCQEKGTWSMGNTKPQARSSTIIVKKRNLGN